MTRIKKTITHFNAKLRRTARSTAKRGSFYRHLEERYAASVWPSAAQEEKARD